MYALAREGTSVHLSYVPGTDMPADYLSRVHTRFFGDVGMALESARDQIVDVLPACARSASWGVLRFSHSIHGTNQHGGDCGSAGGSGGRRESGGGGGGRAWQ